MNHRHRLEAINEVYRIVDLQIFNSTPAILIKKIHVMMILDLVNEQCLYVVSNLVTMNFVHQMKIVVLEVEEFLYAIHSKLMTAMICF